MILNVLIQNLQKTPNLASDLLDDKDPDVMLAQEINLYSESGQDDFSASNVSSLGYGTAIVAHKSNRNKNPTITDVQRVESPFAEFGGLIRKKTTIATIDGIKFVSFHGYNGTPFKSIEKLVAHVDAVLSILSPFGPAVFAGDFNTWTKDHLEAVERSLKLAGFRLVYSWPYPGRDFPLDHAFIRGDLQVEDSSFYSCASDHNGALLQLHLS